MIKLQCLHSERKEKALILSHILITGHAREEGAREEFQHEHVLTD